MKLEYTEEFKNFTKQHDYPSMISVEYSILSELYGIENCYKYGENDFKCEMNSIGDYEMN